MKIDSFDELLAGSPFADKAKEIEKALAAARVKTLDDLDNAPRLLGSSVAGYSTYQICAFLRQAAIEREIQKSVPIVVSKPKPRPKPEKKVVVPVPEEIVIEVPDEDPLGLSEEE